jgi:hypothetical protein
VIRIGGTTTVPQLWQAIATIVGAPPAAAAANAATKTSAATVAPGSGIPARKLRSCKAENSTASPTNHKGGVSE